MTEPITLTVDDAFLMAGTTEIVSGPVNIKRHPQFSIPETIKTSDQVVVIVGAGQVRQDGKLHRIAVMFDLKTFRYLVGRFITELDAITALTPEQEREIDKIKNLLMQKPLSERDILDLDRDEREE